MLGGKRIRKETRLRHNVNNLKICLLLVISLLYARCRYVQVALGYILLTVDRFRSFLVRWRSFQVVVGRFESFLARCRSF